MKFSELKQAEWPDLQPYLDTCLIPVTGLTGREEPWEMTDLAAAAGSWLLPLEQSFKGRTVTLPALHYYDGSEEAADKLDLLCGKCREAGFRHVVLVCGTPNLLRGNAAADLVLQPGAEDEAPDAEALRRDISDLWRKAAAARAQAGGSVGAVQE